MRKIEALVSNRVTVSNRTLAKGETIEAEDDRAKALVELGVAKYAGANPDEPKREVLKGLARPVLEDLPDPDPDAVDRAARVETAEARPRAERAVHKG